MQCIPNCKGKEIHLNITGTLLQACQSYKGLTRGGERGDAHGGNSWDLEKSDKSMCQRKESCVNMPWGCLLNPLLGPFYEILIKAEVCNKRKSSENGYEKFPGPESQGVLTVQEARSGSSADTRSENTIRCNCSKSSKSVYETKRSCCNKVPKTTCSEPPKKSCSPCPSKVCAPKSCRICPPTPSKCAKCVCPSKGPKCKVVKYSRSQSIKCLCPKKSLDSEAVASYNERSVGQTSNQFSNQFTDNGPTGNNSGFKPKNQSAPKNQCRTCRKTVCICFKFNPPKPKTVKFSACDPFDTTRALEENKKYSTSGATSESLMCKCLKLYKCFTGNRNSKLSSDNASRSTEPSSSELKSKSSLSKRSASGTRTLSRKSMSGVRSLSRRSISGVSRQSYRNCNKCSKCPCPPKKKKKKVTTCSNPCSKCPKACVVKEKKPTCKKKCEKRNVKCEKKVCVCSTDNTSGKCKKKCCGNCSEVRQTRPARTINLGQSECGVTNNPCIYRFSCEDKISYQQLLAESCSNIIAQISNANCQSSSNNCFQCIKKDEMTFYEVESRLELSAILESSAENGSIFTTEEGINGVEGSKTSPDSSTYTLSSIKCLSELSFIANKVQWWAHKNSAQRKKNAAIAPSKITLVKNQYLQEMMDISENSNDKHCGTPISIKARTKSLTELVHEKGTEEGTDKLIRDMLACHTRTPSCQNFGTEIEKWVDADFLENSECPQIEITQQETRSRSKNQKHKHRGRSKDQLSDKFKTIPVVSLLKKMGKTTFIKPNRAPPNNGFRPLFL